MVHSSDPIEIAARLGDWVWNCSGNVLFHFYSEARWKNFFSKVAPFLWTKSSTFIFLVDILPKVVEWRHFHWHLSGNAAKMKTFYFNFSTNKDSVYQANAKYWILIGPRAEKTTTFTLKCVCVTSKEKTFVFLLFPFWIWSRRAHKNGDVGRKFEK